MTAVIRPRKTPAGQEEDTSRQGRRYRLAQAFERSTGCTPREILIATALSLAVMLGWVLIMPLVPWTTVGGDPVTYIAMAADPKAVHWAPLAFRVLEPWLANTLGGEAYHLQAMRYLSWMAQAMTGPAVYLITRRFKGSHGAGLLAIIGMMSLPMWLFLVYVPYLVDGMAMLTMAWAMVALVNGWIMVLPVALTFMGLARETVIGFTVPLYMWLRHRWVDLHTAFQVLLIAGPAIVVVWAIRQPMEFTGYQSTLGLMYAGLLVYVKRDVLPNPHWWVFYGTAGSLGIWWLLGIHGRRHGGRLWWLLVPVFAQWLFGSDWARYAFYAFPVVIPAAAIAVWNHRKRNLLLGLVAAQSIAIVADLIVRGRPAIYDLMPSTWVSAGLMIVTAAVLWWDNLIGALKWLSGDRGKAAARVETS